MHTTSRLGIVVLLLLFPVSVPATPPKTDAFGDPLPPHALARLGTTRYRTLDGIRAFALSPDGKVLVAAEVINLVFFDATTGRGTRTRLGTVLFRGDVLQFRDRGRQLLVAGSQGIWVWDVASRKESDRWEKSFSGPVAFSADGRRFATAESQGFPETGSATVWDLAAKKEVATVTPAQKGALWAALSADGKMLATGGKHTGAKGADLQGLVQVWDVATGKEKLRLRTGGKATFAAGFSRDGKLVVTAGHEATVQVWDTVTGRQRGRMTAAWFKQQIGAVGFSADGGKVYAINENGDIALWETAATKLIGRQGSAVDGEVGATFLPSGRFVAWGNRGHLPHLWDPVTGKSLTPPGGHASCIEALGFTPDGKTLYSLDAHAVLLHWDVSAGKERRAFRLQSFLNRPYPPVSEGTPAFAPDSRRLVVPSSSRGLVVIDSASGQEVKLLVKPRVRTYDNWQTAFSADGSKLGAFPLSADPSWETVAVPIWDTTTGREVGRVKVALGEPGKGLPINRSVFGTFSRDGKRAAIVAVREGTAELTGWDLLAGKKLAACKFPAEWGATVALAADGRTAVVSCQGGKLWVCDVLTGRQRAIVRRIPDDITAGPLFSPDGRSVAIATAGGWGPAIHIFECVTWAERHNWFLPTRASALAFTPDGRTLASGHTDTTILLWDLWGRSDPRR